MVNYFDPATNRKFRKELKFYLHKFIICPNQWKTLRNKYKTISWNKVQFKNANKPYIPTREGLYFFTVCPDITNAHFVNYLFYVGETGNLQQRFQDYLNKIDHPKTSQYNMYTLITDYPNHLYFHYTEFPGSHKSQRKAIEDEFLIAFLPPRNGIYPQQIHKIVTGVYNT